jgi:glyoxylase-like metal-dependent hydrolase (beta-lactamase superfamily II)
MNIERIIVGPLATNCYVVSCPGSDDSIVIDPGGDGDRIASYVDGAGLSPVLIVLTHGHSDHFAAAAALARRYGTPVAMHGDDLDTLARSAADAPMWGLGRPEPPEIGRELCAGDTIRFGSCEGTVLHTPGHTKGGICIAFDGVVFAGDTLFAGSIGRTDFYGGDMETILESIRQELFALPDGTVVHTGHGPSTTIGEEKAGNPFLTGDWV